MLSFNRLELYHIKTQTATYIASVIHYLKQDLNDPTFPLKGSLHHDQHYPLLMMSHAQWYLH